MIRITTTVISGPNGRPQVRATGEGRTRTHNTDLSKSDAWNRGAAAGTLLAVLATPEQKAKILHPSGGQRIAQTSLSEGGGKYRFAINV
jgi:hypothetical protein